VRPDAEETPNRLGATLNDLRTAVETAAGELAAAGDKRLHVLPGLPIITGDDLVDEVHPGDSGHAKLAAAAATAMRSLLATG
jgi:hypothetical protein